MGETNMPTYAYRWADGTVSVCSARNKDEAMELFDEVGPVSRKLIIRLKSPILFTSKPNIDKGWVLDDQALGEQLYLEVVEKCYPHYDSMLDKCNADLKTGDYTNQTKKKLTEALHKDQEEVKEQMKRTPETPDIVVLFPKGLPGQNN
jgi:hypothetical protein